MANFVAERGRGGGNTSPGTTLALAVSGVTVGNKLILLVHLSPPSSGGVSVSSITDDVGNVWTVDASASATATGAVHGFAICSCNVGAAPGLVTIHLSGQTTIAYKLDEFGGGVGAVDVSAAGHTNASVNVATSAITPAAAGELLIAGFGPPAAEASFTPGAGYTQAGTPRNAVAEIIAEYLLAAPAGSQNATGTVPTAGIGNYAHAIAAYLSSHVSDSGRNTMAVSQQAAREAKGDAGRDVLFNTQQAAREAKGNAGRNTAAVVQVTQHANRADAGVSSMLAGLGPALGVPQAIVDQGRDTLAVVPLKAKEARADSGRNTETVAQVAQKEARADRARNIEAVTQKAGTAPATVDSGRDTFAVFVPFHAASTGVNVQAVTQRNIKQAVADDDVPLLGSLTLTGGESTHVADAGKNALAVSSKGADQRVDAGRSTLTVAGQGSEQRVDQGRNVVPLFQPQTDVPSDAGVSVMAVAQITQKWAKADTSPALTGYQLLPTSAEQRVDQGRDTLAVAQRAIREAPVDSGRVTAAVAQLVVKEAPAAAAKAALTVTQQAGAPAAIADSGRNTLGIVGPTITPGGSGVNALTVAQQAAGRQAASGQSTVHLTGGEKVAADAGVNVEAVIGHDVGWGSGGWGDPWGDAADPQAVVDQGRNNASAVQRTIRASTREAGRNVFALAAPHLKDAGRNTFAFTEVAAEQRVDSGRNTLTGAQKGVDAARDSGRSAAILTPSTVKEARADTGQSSALLAQPERDARADRGVNTLALSQPPVSLHAGSNTMAVTQREGAPAALVDAGRSSAQVTQKEAERSSDKGLNAPAVVTRSIREAPTDSGRNAAPVTQRTAKEAKADSGRSTATLVTVSSTSPADSGRNTQAITQRATAAPRDAAVDQFAVAQAAAHEGARDAGADTAGLTAATVKNAVSEAGTNQLTITDSQRLSAAGRNTLQVTPTGEDLTADAGRNTATLVAANAVVSASGRNTATMVQRATDARGDAGRSTSILSQAVSHGQAADKGLNPAALTPREAQPAAVVDTGRNVLAVVELAAAARSDSGRNTVAVAGKAAERKADQGTNAAVVAAGPSHGAVAEHGTSVAAVAQITVEAVGDRARNPLVVTQKASGSSAQTGLNTVTVAGKAASAIHDTAAARFALSQPTAGGASDAGMNVVGVGQAGQDARGDRGRALLGLASTASHGGPSDQGRNFLFQEQAGVDAVHDAGADAVEVIQAGTLVPSATGGNTVTITSAGAARISESGVNAFALVELEGPVVLYRVGRLHPRWQGRPQRARWKARPPRLLTNSPA